VGGQLSNTAGNTSYQRPIISYFKGLGSSGGVTFGGQTVQIFGRNFGPFGTEVTAMYAVGASAKASVNASVGVVVPTLPAMTGVLRFRFVFFDSWPPLSVVADVEISVYGTDGDPVVFPALNCFVAEAHLVVNCTTAPGVGTGLAWVVSIGNQTSQAPVTSYASPEIMYVGVRTDTGLSDSALLATKGGDVIVINGTNFGPAFPRAYVTTVQFGKYVIPGCDMTIPHVQLVCRTQPGTGTSLRWMVRDYVS
jgi:hypothetical protein